MIYKITYIGEAYIRAKNEEQAYEIYYEGNYEAVEMTAKSINAISEEEYKNILSQWEEE